MCIATGPRRRFILFMRSRLTFSAAASAMRHVRLTFDRKRAACGYYYRRVSDHRDSRRDCLLPEFVMRPAHTREKRRKLLLY